MVRDSKEHPGAGSAIASARSLGAERSDDARDADLIVDEVLVEDVSIDGMCGVY